MLVSDRLDANENRVFNTHINTSVAKTKRMKITNLVAFSTQEFFSLPFLACVGLGNVGGPWIVPR